MKKAVLSIMLIFAILSFVGCGSNNDSAAGYGGNLFGDTNNSTDGVGNGTNGFNNGGNLGDDIANGVDDLGRDVDDIFGGKGTDNSFDGMPGSENIIGNNNKNNNSNYLGSNYKNGDGTTDYEAYSTR